MSTREWALILGVSSGFGAASAIALAKAGYDILGVHLDTRSNQARVDSLLDDLQETGQQIRFFNQNAASDESRRGMIQAINTLLSTEGGRIKILLHSLAFGSLGNYISEDKQQQIKRRQLEMTLDVMGNSLLYWVQDLEHSDLLDRARIFAMTSAGSHRVWASYGPVAAAKATLESHIRQLAVELAPKGHTVNGILAGVTDTPALSKIPGSETLKEDAINRNPHQRLTTPKDVARCLVALSSQDTYWMTGNVIAVDGGEGLAG